MASQQLRLKVVFNNYWLDFPYDPFYHQMPEEIGRNGGIIIKIAFFKKCFFNTNSKKWFLHVKIIINNAIFIRDSSKKDFDNKYWYMAAWKVDICLSLFDSFFFAIVPSHFTVGIWFYKFPVVNSAHDPLGLIYTGAPNDNFWKNICLEDNLRSRIFGTFVVKLLACLPLLGFSNM